jgi:hypothetical protein
MKYNFQNEKKNLALAAVYSVIYLLSLFLGSFAAINDFAFVGMILFTLIFCWKGRPSAMVTIYSAVIMQILISLLISFSLISGGNGGTLFGYIAHSPDHGFNFFYGIFFELIRYVFVLIFFQIIFWAVKVIKKKFF